MTLGPSVRLVYFPLPDAMANAFGTPPPVLRLSHRPGAQGDGTLMDAPTVRLSVGSNPRGRRALQTDLLPAVLVSYVYVDGWLKNRSKYYVRDWALDSGAFSAFNSGMTIDLSSYIDLCARLLEEDGQLSEVFALDVIGDPEGGLRNTEEMWRQGVPAIPCYHYGEPEDVLLEIARKYPKIALGGATKIRGKKKLEWAAQCFARVWPKKIHGFGFGSEAAQLHVPWHSTDATNWEIGPCKFGTWRSYGGSRLRIRGSHHPLRVEVEYYLRIEARARARWKKEMMLLETQDA